MGEITPTGAPLSGVSRLWKRAKKHGLLIVCVSLLFILPCVNAQTMLRGEVSSEHSLSIHTWKEMTYVNILHR
jgi:hypothetical protein